MSLHFWTICITLFHTLRTNLIIHLCKRPEGFRLQASCVILLQLQCCAQISGQPWVGNVSVLLSAADAVYSLAGAAGRLDVFLLGQFKPLRTVTWPAGRLSKLSVCVIDVFEVTLTGRLLADCSTDTCHCSIGQSQEQPTRLETYVFYMALEKIELLPYCD